LESEFDLIVPEEEFANIKTVQDSVDLVHKYLATI
jgi:acyl carrier protein